MPVPFLSLDAVSYAYAGRESVTLDALSLCLGGEEKLGILGANGCGKSTLLHILTGLLRPQAGSLFWRGKELTCEADFRALRWELGYVVQRAEDQLFCATVLDDVAFGLLNKGIERHAAGECALTLLQELGIGHLASYTGHTLSGGEQRLAALATVLVMEPQFILLDEPTNDLDTTAYAVLSEVLLRRNLPCIIISHDRSFLEAQCTTFLELQAGKLIPVDGSLPSSDVSQSI